MNFDRLQKREDALDKSASGSSTINDLSFTSGANKMRRAGTIVETGRKQRKLRSERTQRDKSDPKLEVEERAKSQPKLGSEERSAMY